MRKINFTKDILPHAVAVLVFLVVTIFFFSPVFFDNKSLSQHDIQMSQGAAKGLLDYRTVTGEEGLWAASSFCGMPAYLVSVSWSDGALVSIKRVASVFLPHPVNNIFLSFLCFYIMLLAFGVRPWLAIAGALAFGLSSYMILGLSAGHNARIGAIAFMPLVMAGIHLVLTNRRILGFAATVGGLALHLRENHLQITYYLIMIVAVYGLIRLIQAIREKTIANYLSSLGLLVGAALIAACTFFGQFWAITEYSHFSIRGPSELVRKNVAQQPGALSKTYAFEYSVGIWEPMTLIIPNFYGGSSGNLLAGDQKSNVYQALVSSNDQRANQLQYSTGAYWGALSYTGGAYYAGAVVFFLFVIGILFADKKYVWWLVPLSAFCVVLTWGDNFAAFNYFMFDYFPGYDKFRSPTFAIIIALLAMPLLGFIGLERLIENGLNKDAKRKLLIALSATGGVCVIALLFGGLASFQSATEVRQVAQKLLPDWFMRALEDDRQQLMRADAIRSLGFILAVFIALYLDMPKRVSVFAFAAFLTVVMIIDIGAVDHRYFTKDNYHRKYEAAFAATAADEALMQDSRYYRVYNLNPQDPTEAMREARTSYFHYSLGGYNGAKLRRYQDLYDSAIFGSTMRLLRDASTGKVDFRNYGVFNMLNTRYIVYGPEANNIIANPFANGNGWFVRKVITVNSPTEELKTVTEIDTKDVAVIDGSKFKIADVGADSSARVRLLEFTLPRVTYETESTIPGLAVFSEIYYSKGWHATVDGKEVPILRADYVLRALEIPAGKHSVEFKFEPAPYVIGNKITMASGWAVLLIVVGCLGWSFRKPNELLPA